MAAPLPGGGRAGPARPQLGVCPRSRTAPPEKRLQPIAALRRQRLLAWQIAERLGNAGLDGLDDPDPDRTRPARPGELVHIDVKKLGRIGRPGHRVNGDRRRRSHGIGWEYMHVCVDTATRLAYVEVLADEKAVSAVGFLRHAVARSTTTITADPTRSRTTLSSPTARGF